MTQQNYIKHNNSLQKDRMMSGIRKTYNTTFSRVILIKMTLEISLMSYDDLTMTIFAVILFLPHVVMPKVNAPVFASLPNKIQIMPKLK